MILGGIPFWDTPKSARAPSFFQGSELDCLRAARILACCLLVLPLAGTVRKSVSHSRAKTLIHAAENVLPEPVRATFQEGRDLFRAGRYLAALQKFESVRRSAVEINAGAMVLRAESNVGACRFALRQYRSALDSFLNARKLAKTAGDDGAAAVLDINIASLYSEVGELEVAAEWTRSALEIPADPAARRQYPLLLIQMATLNARQNHMPEAVSLFRKALDAADREGDWNAQALAWNRLGEEWLRRRNLGMAESALLEAYRIRKLQRLPLDSSYCNLGRLRLEQGDIVSASHLLDRAVELARPDGLAAPWESYHYRGRARLAQGRLREALADLRIAVRLGRAWRWSAPAVDAARIGAEGSLHDAYAALIETGNRLNRESPSEALVLETFEAAEENRADSLRTLILEGREDGMPPEFWEAVQSLQRAELAALASNAAAGHRDLAAARADVARFEAEASGAMVPQSRLLERTQAKLPADAVLLSFSLGARRSWLWAVDDGGPAVFALPGRERIEEQSAALEKAILDDAPHARTAGASLYRTLFSALPQRFTRKKRWLLSLDGPLFKVPFAALVETSGANSFYLAERRTIQVVPGAAVWLDAAEASAPGDLFLGIGDPIYNAADPRLPQASALKPGPFRLFAAPLPGSATLLPRLVASSGELNRCAREWRGEAVLLKGKRAGRLEIGEQLRRKPAVVHFATHILSSRGNTPHGLIALSLSQAGEAQALGPIEVGRLRLPGAVVTLSGCHSAAGSVLPSTGLMGLTRAWIAAGARSVVASRWSVPDESGELFAAFYRRLRPGASLQPAEALRFAQVEMIRSGGWRSRPRYWGAYFAVGTE